MNDMDVIGRITEKLKDDQALSAYVKSVMAGDMDCPRKVYPWVAVGKLECSIRPLTLGRGGYDVRACALEIRAGVRSMVPGEAFGGDRGILQLCEDIVSALRPNDFGGLFDGPASIVSVVPCWKKDAGVLTCRITIRGEIKERRAV